MGNDGFKTPVSVIHEDVRRIMSERISNLQEALDEMTRIAQEQQKVMKKFSETVLVLQMENRLIRHLKRI
jgi:hypothetical protein